MTHLSRLALMLALFALAPGALTYAQSDFSTTPLNGAGSAASPVDLLMDSDSYVPPFYQGRALPSAGAHIRLQAIPNFKRADGSLIPSSSIVFTWRQDDRVVGTESGLGKSSIVLPAEILYGTSNIEVDARAEDGSRYGSALLSVPSQEPQLVLYEDSPLLGLMFYRALGVSTNIPESEMTFAVVPYFAHITGPDDARLAYQWSVNGSPVAPAPSNPSELTLSAKGSDGSASLALSVTQTDDIFLSPTGSWSVHLGSSGIGYSSGGTGAKSPFSGQ